MALRGDIHPVSYYTINYRSEGQPGVEDHLVDVSGVQELARKQVTQPEGLTDADKKVEAHTRVCADCAWYAGLVRGLITQKLDEDRRKAARECRSPACRQPTVLVG